jgi:hypothetical protein
LSREAPDQSDRESIRSAEARWFEYMVSIAFLTKLSDDQRYARSFDYRVINSLVAVHHPVQREAEERDAEREAEHYAEREAERVAGRYAEHDAERDAEYYAEREAERDAERYAEHDAERDAEEEEYAEGVRRRRTGCCESCGESLGEDSDCTCYPRRGRWAHDYEEFERRESEADAARFDRLYYDSDSDHNPDDLL